MLEPREYIILGDFNCVLDSNRDIRGPGQGGSTYNSKELKKLLLQNKMSDAWIVKHGNNYEPTRISRITTSRIDRIYTSPKITQNLEDCRVQGLPQELADRSDHRPIIVTITGEPGRLNNPNTWRMNATLLQDIESIEEIKQALQHSVMDTIQHKKKEWDELKIEWREILETAGKNRCKRITNKLTEISRRIQITKNGELTFTTQEYLECMRMKYDETLREAAQASKKATQQKLAEDELADLTYAQNNDMRSTKDNRIEKMQTIEGTITTDHQRIEETLVHHFTTLFQTEKSREITELKNMINSFCYNCPQIDTDSDSLCAPVTMRELENTLKIMKQTTAPGPDGIITGFYKTFLKEIGDTLLEMINNFIINKHKPASFNIGHVTLILKEGGDPTETGSWRPITLLNTDYKIVTTLLSKRLTKLLPYIITPYQASSVPGRSIFATLTLIGEFCLHATQTIKWIFYNSRPVQSIRQSRTRLPNYTT